MDSFVYWYTYFDSIFLKAPPSLPASFFQQVHFKSMSSKKWPEYQSLPELPHLLADLQAFFMANLWKKCSLSRQQAQKLQSELNKLMTLVQVQKIYAQQFWNNKRRVEASFIHYFILVKQLVITFIPQNCNTLNQTISQKKFCLEMKHIEKLINHFLHHLPPIYNFLLDAYFEQQISLIGQLFQEITVFCKTLPSLTKTQLSEIPKIVRYICLNNSLESISQDRKDVSIQSPSDLFARKKSTTSHMKGKKKGKKEVREKSIYEKGSNKSQDQSLERQEMENRSDHSVPKKDKSMENKDIPRLFKFKRTIFREKKNIQLSVSPQSSINLSRGDSNSPSRRNQRMRSTTISPISPFSHKNSISSRNKDKRDTFYTDRSRFLTRANSIVQPHNIVQFAEEEEEERKVASNKFQQIKIPKVDNLSTRTNLQTGRSRGWAIIRQYVFTRVAQRKLRKLIFS